MGFSTRVGKYELGREIGEGRFAKVRVARNIETGLKVAIKIIEKKMILRLNLRHQVKREINTMNLVKHPNIVRLYEVIASKKKVYLVMEYVTGGDLSDKIAYLQKITEEEARKYFHQLIDAVDYCHGRNVYHRDLKPQNLLLDGKANLKVSDFGLSILHQRITIAQIYENEWFKKDYYPPAEPWDEQETNSDDVHAAFGITEVRLP
eukprot:PITA_27211